MTERWIDVAMDTRIKRLTLTDIALALSVAFVAFGLMVQPA